MKKRPRQSGLTLVELVMAVVILGIAVPPILFVFTEIATHGIVPERQTTAYFLAMERLEDVIGDRHSPNRGYPYLVASNYPDDAPVTGYTRSVAFVEVSSTDLTTPDVGSGYLRVTVTVSYTGPDGGTALSCILCDLS